MRRRSRSDELEELDSDDELPPRSPPRRGARGSRRHGRSAPGVKPWSADGEFPEDDSTESEEDSGFRGLLHRPKRPVFFRARDSLFFEPLVALAIIVLLLVSLYAYTQNWPPVYVVESESMQHGLTDQVGLINTGDLVLAQRVSLTQVTPYFVGLQTGYSTYGEYGDVVLYHPNGVDGGTPIIHRALLYLQYEGNGSYSIPELGGLSCGTSPQAAYSSQGGNGCAYLHLRGTLKLFRIGWRDATVSIDLASMGGHSGFLTMGDNNFAAGGGGVIGETDQGYGLSSLVAFDWVVGVARGMIPWFGAVKLYLQGNAGMVPPQSWEFMGLSLIALGLLAFGIHYAFRPREERTHEHGDRSSDPDEEDDGEEVPPVHPRWRGLRAWMGGSSEPSDEGEEGPTEPARRGRGPSHGSARSSWRGRRGRPRPTVLRSKEKPHHASRHRDDEDR